MTKEAPFSKLEQDKYCEGKGMARFIGAAGVQQDGQGSLHGKVKCEYRLGGGKGARQMNTWRNIPKGQHLSKKPQGSKECGCCTVDRGR